MKVLALIQCLFGGTTPIRLASSSCGRSAGHSELSGFPIGTRESSCDVQPAKGAGARRYLINSLGLFEGLKAALTPAQFDTLDGAFFALACTAEGVGVRNPGELVADSFHRDNAATIDRRQHFQVRLRELLQGCLNGAPPHQRCCSYHNNKLIEIAPTVSSTDGKWLLTFFEVLTAYSLELHFQIPSALDPNSHPPIQLSRLMPLHRFIPAFTDSPPGPSSEQRYADELKPQLGKRARTRARGTGAVGRWGGRFGSYPTATVAFGASAKPYLTYCEAVKPFATLTADITADFNREGPPDDLLKNLGLAFAPNIRWIELIYKAENAAFIDANRRHLLGVPTRIESAGNWAFTPDPDHDSNHALDLRNGRRGGREVVHQPFDHRALEDAIVWGAPTQNDWSHPASPLAL